MSFEKFFPDRHCTSLGPAEKERESVMLHLKQEEYTPAPLGPKDWRLICRFVLGRLSGKGEQPSPGRSKNLKSLKQYY